MAKHRLFGRKKEKDAAQAVNTDANELSGSNVDELSGSDTDAPTTEDDRMPDDTAPIQAKAVIESADDEEAETFAADDAEEADGAADEGEAADAATDTDEEEKHRLTEEELRRIIRESRPALFVIQAAQATNSTALRDLAMLSGWCGGYKDRCNELELPGAAGNFQFMQIALEQSARGLMDVMFASKLQPSLPDALVADLQAGKIGLTFETYRDAVLAENPLELDEDAAVPAMLIAMHSNLEQLFIRVAEASQEARLAEVEPLRTFHVEANANPLVAVASASLTVDRSYQFGAFGPEYWIFLPEDHRDTWRGTNLTRIDPEDLPTKFRIPCSFMHVSRVPGIPEDDSVPLSTFAHGTWAPLHDESVTQYCLDSIREWLAHVK